MAVYVDDMYKSPIGEFGGMKMSHMIADSTNELLALADCIGVARKWLQKPGTSREHFDVSMSKRRLAIQHGAIPVTMEELCTRTTWRRKPVIRIPRASRSSTKR